MTCYCLLKEVNTKSIAIIFEFFYVKILFIGLRGGVSQCSHRYSEANNKYMEDYDPMKPKKFIAHLDINNLYGWAMKQYLPLCEHKWHIKNDANVKEVLEAADDSEFGYFIEVDLSYPKKLHDLHSDYPMCPEQKIPPNSKHKKLLLTLNDKVRHVLHYRTLQQALDKGLVLKKVHRIVKFRQSAWLKEYIELNTKERQKTKHAFEKNLYKLMSNAVYGKTMENVRDRVIVKIETKWNGRYGAKNYISKPNFKKSVIFNENFVLIEMNKVNIKMNKPIIIGASILEISKIKMYDFHYNYMVPKFQKNCKIMYTDTDSFIYEIFCDDFYKIIRKDKHMFDTSDYSPDNPYKIQLLNKKIPGLMKDEYNGKIMTHFVGLRSKMYSTKVQKGKNTKKIKGIKKYVIENKITFEDFYKCIKENCKITRKQNSIRSKLHKIYTIEQSKVTLDPYDDKRYLCKNGIDTLPWGHYKIKKMKLN